MIRLTDAELQRLPNLCSCLQNNQAYIFVQDPASALHISRIIDNNQRPPLLNFAGNDLSLLLVFVQGGANNFSDDMPGAGAVKAQPSSNVTNVVPLNHTGMVACSVTEEATGANSCSVVEPVSGGVTADGPQLPEDVDVVKNHAMVSFPALGMSKLNARY
ncbi:hypothetical protein F2Q70_00028397 [Brassica cretica]|uniref:Uncharacterized protein n=1 Tax=Brassica cretica TaxID=69181 RepID=A0A8S9L4N9_BRACR|nr:hypothetical protein F2Q70_00028397 [Brassica cretica]